MSCSYYYKGESVEFESCSGVPQGAANAIPKYDEIGTIPMKIMRYKEPHSGEVYDIFIRAVPWDDLGIDFQNYLMDTDLKGQKTTPEFVFQAALSSSKDDFKEQHWDERMYVEIDPMDALGEALPWNALERMGEDMVVVEGRGHPLFQRAKETRYKHKTEAQLAQIAKTQEEEARRIAAEKEAELAEATFWSRVGNASDFVVAKKTSYQRKTEPHRVKYDGEVTAVDAYEIERRSDGKSTGIVVNKSRQGKDFSWEVTHTETGYNFVWHHKARTKTDGVRIAYGLSLILDWTLWKTDDDVPENVSNQVREFLDEAKRHL